MSTSVGRFVWYELLTSDVKGAIAFYSDVIGWKTQPFDEGPDAYVMWVASQGPLGGVYPLPEQAKQMGAPPHWTAHVEVANVDHSTKQAAELGGKVLVEPRDTPKVGRFSVIADPQGATICLFTPSHPMPTHDHMKDGEMSWNELITTDHEAALRFYGTLFGWEKKSDFDMGAMGKYVIYGQERAYGGMFTKSKDMPMPPAWLYYIHVDDLDAAVERAKQKGAKLMNGPMDVPGGDRIAQLMDPQGAAFALHTTKK